MSTEAAAKETVVEINWEIVARAETHILRTRIIDILATNDRVMTPKQIAAELELPLENVSYHVRVVANYRHP